MLRRSPEGTWESQTGHAAALRANDDERQNDYTAKLNCDAAIQEYIDRGVRDYQLVMGLNIYGAGWQGQSLSLSTRTTMSFRRQND